MSMFENTKYYLVGQCSERTRNRIAVLNSTIVSDTHHAPIAVINDNVNMNNLRYDNVTQLLVREMFFLDITDQKKEEYNGGSILTEAESIVTGARSSDYGSAHESFERIGSLTEMLLDQQEREALKVCCIQPSVVVKIQLALKLTRETNKHKRDNLVDLCGYAELLNRLQSEDRSI